MYVLEAMNGPLDGKRWRFDARIVIGRDGGDATAALPVDRAVSRRHAQIDATGEQLSIVDLGSSNGTIVRGEPVLTALIAAGEPFVVGRTMLRVLRAE
jgi:pSer/pThr/pTyr-binding forkhead associated (FHA) protein